MRPSSSGSNVHQQPISTSGNATNAQAVNNNGNGAAGSTFNKTDERVLISVGSIGTYPCPVAEIRALANICCRRVCPSLLSDLDYQKSIQKSSATSVTRESTQPWCDHLLSIHEEGHFQAKRLANLEWQFQGIGSAITSIRDDRDYCR